MINPKNICISASIGFCLSFVIGLFSDVHFSTVLLRALLFALVFAALCVGISILYQNFLSSDNGSFISDTDSSAKSAVGGVVNIVVDDSNLPDEEMSPKFTVLNNHSDLNGKANLSSQPQVHSVPVSSPPVDSIQVSSQASSSEEAPASDFSFKPVSLGQAGAVSTSESKSSPVSISEPSVSSGNMAGSAPVAAANEKIESLDELPDISDMPVGSSEDLASNLDSSSEEIISDSEFASGNAAVKEQPISGDTSVMAKAIQTLLAKDN